VKVAATTRNVDPQVMEFDSEFWGVRIGRAGTVDGLSQWAAENTVGLIWLLVDADRPEEAQRAEEAGFRMMDVRVTLERTAVAAPGLTTVARMAATDLDAAVGIARGAHRITRFYADPLLPDDRCDDLYESWVRQSYGGWADAVFVTRDAVSVTRSQGEAVGYVTVHVNSDTGSIGLIAVHERCRCLGLGRELVWAAIDHAWRRGCKTITVVTQGRNVAALRLFEGCGFRITNTSLWFHKWVQESQDPFKARFWQFAQEDPEAFRDCVAGFLDKLADRVDEA